MPPLADRVRARLTFKQRRRIALARVALRRPTAPLRLLPDFLVIGAQRCGTSSLFRYLAQHPWVGRPLRKEVEYFTVRFHEGPDWYRAHFPLRLRRTKARLVGCDLRTFEATPDYLFFPGAAERAAELLPEARLVALLRDPVERAWSHYRHVVRLGREPLGFDEAIEAEPERLAGEVERAGADPAYPARSLRLHSYAARGRYAEHLAPWIERYGRERLLVVRAEDLFAEPETTYLEILRFLGLPGAMPRDFRNFSYPAASGGGGAARHAAAGSPAPEPTAARLRAYFAPYNRELGALLDRELGW